ncbi:MAG TPA: arsenosugar biosynthesis radical SAM (seleno)protein ArsS [Syntrophobacteria bacterium]|nr:arsenosugar biosynthesis radical SAM (seleno)protein ArsS [Syntrophobacteria bacterium]
MEEARPIRAAEECWGRRLPRIEPFRQTLARHGLELTRGETTTLQVNVGLLCNQACHHCHLEAGPDRREVMKPETGDAVVAFVRRCRVGVIDITGGAPELNPKLGRMIKSLAPFVPRIMLRSNLTALRERERDSLVDLCRNHRVAIVASLPSLNEAQAESQRGRGVFRKSIAALQRLNSLGYGRADLELNLVVNPTGAFLPPSQEQTARRFREVLHKKWGITFNHLFTFANVPLGRFRHWLERSGNLESYTASLVARFNPCAVQGLMCRTLVSVSWDGYLYDCDFNLARGLPLGGRKIHISDTDHLPAPGTSIAVSDHCYTCTAGAGFT